MYTIDDIEMDDGVYSYLQMINAMMHDKNRYGIKGMCKRYEESIEAYREMLPLNEFCAVLGVLEHFDESFHYDESVKMPKIVLDIFTWSELFDLGDRNISDIDSIVKEEKKRSLPSFEKRNILLDCIEEAV